MARELHFRLLHSLFIRILVQLEPDLVHQHEHVVSLTVLRDEDLAARDSPNLLLFGYVIEENGWVPARQDALVRFIKGSLSQEGGEDDGPLKRLRFLIARVDYGWVWELLFRHRVLVI